MDLTAEQQRAAERIGRVLRGKWTLEAVVGVGGLAVVYSATHRAGRRVAIKVLHPEVSASQEIRTRFVREAHVANKIGHPGVVPVIDDDVTEQGEAFLVMELLEGETLQQRRKRWGGRLPPMEVLQYGDAVLDVLIAAHGKGILHRDIKPENLFITRDGRVIVLDFGLARLADNTNENATIAGLPMGSPPYMSPEQATGQWDKVDVRSDLFSVAATMFKAMTSAFIHGSGTPSQMLVAACTKAATPIRTVMPDLPEPVANVIDRGLAFDPAQRYQTAHEMQGAVREVIATMSQYAPLGEPQRLTMGTELTVGELEGAMHTPHGDVGSITELRTGAPTAHSSPQVQLIAMPAPRRGATIALFGAVVTVAALVGVVSVIALNSAGSSPDANNALASATASAAPAAPPPVVTEVPAAAPTPAPPTTTSASAAKSAEPASTKPSKRGTPPPPPPPPPTGKGKARESDDDLLGFGKGKK